MNRTPLSVIRRLAERTQNDSYRRLGLKDLKSVDFYSNDYLGLSRDDVFQSRLFEELSDQLDFLTSSTGSRLISGNTSVMEETEAFIADKHHVEAALLFSSGYDANLALLGCIPTNQSTVIIDEFAHRSIHDGCRLSMAKKWKFKHNDLCDLESKLNKAHGEVFVVVESLYSMDGDFSPLHELVLLCERFGAFMIVDEAHAIGVYGLGLVYEQNLHKGVFATVVTYGKAMGVHGAAVLGSNVLKDMLINFGSSFIYSTAPPSYMALSIKYSYRYLENYNFQKKSLFDRINYYNKRFSPFFPCNTSPIQIIKLEFLQEVAILLDKIRTASIDCVLIKAPTIQLGSERFRICIHVHNTEEEINALLKIILEHRKEELI